MEQLYFLVSQCDTWLNNDPNGFLQQFFVVEGGFTYAFLIALGVAVICAAIFYGWIGMAVNKLANLVVWLCTMLVGALATFILTRVLVIGSNDVGTGIFKSISEKLPNVLATMSVDDEVGRTQVMSQANALKDALTGVCDVTTHLYITNVVLAIVIFLIVSICVKNVTTHATHVPF